MLLDILQYTVILQNAKLFAKKINLKRKKHRRANKV